MTCFLHLALSFLAIFTTTTHWLEARSSGELDDLLSPFGIVVYCYFHDDYLLAGSTVF